MNILLEHLEWNLKRLEEVCRNSKTDYYRDAALQRYGFAVNSAIRCIRSGAALRNLCCDNPAECFELAHQQGWLGKDGDWKDLVDSLSQMNPAALQSHAESIYSKLESYRKSLKTLYLNLSDLA